MAAALPEEAWLTALLSLPGLGPARLALLLADGSAESAWRAVIADHPRARACSGDPAVASAWAAAARQTRVAERWQRYRDLGVGVLGRGSAGYPAPLRDDPEPPEVLFVQGDVGALGAQRVGVVGTRNCTRYGLDLAFEIGALCAREGITVVSGLAAGIDAAAHRGALAAGGAPPVAVVGTALDRPYPTSNAGLWTQVRAQGLVCGEAPLGAPVERWRFPARNRIIAGLSQVIVVIESHERGGSLYTAAQAMDRDRTVFAVPGSIRSPASAGCNRLLADGCLPLCAPEDVLVALGLAAGVHADAAPEEIDQWAMRLLDAVGWQPTAIDELVDSTGAELGTVALAVEELVGRGLLARRGRWLERTGRSARVRGPNDPAGRPEQTPWSIGE